MTMNPIRFVLMILALVCFGLSAYGISVPRGGDLKAAGLFFWALATMIT